MFSATVSGQMTIGSSTVRGLAVQPRICHLLRVSPVSTERMMHDLVIDHDLLTATIIAASFFLDSDSLCVQAKPKNLTWHTPTIKPGNECRHATCQCTVLTAIILKNTKCPPEQSRNLLRSALHGKTVHKARAHQMLLSATNCKLRLTYYQVYYSPTAFLADLSDSSKHICSPSMPLQF
jgi:hypothetical protein